MQFDLKQAKALVDLFGTSDETVTVIEHDGELKAYCTEYPEEGAVEL